MNWNVVWQYFSVCVSRSLITILVRIDIVLVVIEIIKKKHDNVGTQLSHRHDLPHTFTYLFVCLRALVIPTYVRPVKSTFPSIPGDVRQIETRSRSDLSFVNTR